MSYLAALRLHFSGRFQAAVSTVNNDPAHFDNATFKPEYQQPGSGQANGWWNPHGNADWRFIGCAVTAASYADGGSADVDDPVLTMLVADSDRRAPAKLVDLDPDQQLVSTVWGLEVRVCDKQGATLVRGRFAPAAFTDVWFRALRPDSARDDFMMCAAYQSVLTDLEWGDVSGSRLLSELREAATDGLLSMRFNVDGYNMTHGTPDFTLGRVVGTIGVGSASEPRHFVAGRQFMTVLSPRLFPAGSINFCTAVVDEARGRIILDLGNALPTTEPGGPPASLGQLTLGYLAGASANPTPIGTIDYLAAGWYEKRAGVCEVPVDADRLAAIAGARLTLQFAGKDAVLESPGGLYVRPDEFVHRLDPGDVADVLIVATRYGRPYAGAQIAATEDDSQVQSPVGAVSALSFPATLEPTGADGTATLPITASDPGNPRAYIDGQVYGVQTALADQAADYPADPWNFVSVLVFDTFVPDDPITWWGSLQPIFQQYANLYPVMALFLDLSDYDSVCENRELLLLAFGLDVTDPNSMPVTRDLSRAKRTAILSWLAAPGPDGKPLLGTPPPPQAAVPRELVPAESPAPPREGAPRGGKTAALARRRAVVRAAAEDASR
jgi:hypothetical protein